MRSWEWVNEDANLFEFLFEYMYYKFIINKIINVITKKKQNIFENQIFSFFNSAPVKSHPIVLFMNYGQTMEDITKFLKTEFS